MKSTIQSNYVLLCFYFVYLIFLYFLFQSSFVIILILHGILILIALTPIGEGIMRLLNHTKKIKTREYQDYLYPLFEEVYEQAKKQNPHLSQNITLFMNNDTSPNAFACASNTVCVTKGAIDFFTREELQGVLAHEFGHLSNNDTKVCMVFVIGNLLVIVFMALFNALFWVADTIVSMFQGRDHIALRVVRWLKKVISNLGSMLVGAIFSLNSRVCEYGADKFAHDIGFGAELRRALGMLQKLDGGGDMTLMDRIYASHPDTENRIAQLESLEDIEEDEGL
ncbi:MAG: M48 family metalloprotease [Bacilli bacterium]|jgi:heat shock protein HtpX|nr:M48 family metalloprotease [Bacilli bacterium]